jgi:hypothetical protein
MLNYFLSAHLSTYSSCITTKRPFDCAIPSSLSPVVAPTPAKILRSSQLVYGWNKKLDSPEIHLKEKYFGGRNRKGMNYPLDKNEIKKKIKASYKEHKLGGGIKQEEFNAKDTHLSNNAFLIGTFATYK